MSCNQNPIFGSPCQQGPNNNSNNNNNNNWWQGNNQQPSPMPLPSPMPAPLPLPGPLPGQMPSNNNSFPPALETVSFVPETLTEPFYTAGYLRTQLGRLMRVEFLIGNTTTDRVGVLSEVGASFIVLDSLEAKSKIMCDLFSIKFVTIIETPANGALYERLYANM